MEQHAEYFHEKPSWCPLRQMIFQKKDEYIDSNYVPMIGFPEKLRSEYNVGWNDCIDEICGNKCGE